MQKSQIVIVNSNINNNNNRCVVRSVICFDFCFAVAFVCDVFRWSSFIGRDLAIQDVYSLYCECEWEMSKYEAVASRCQSSVAIYFTF